MGILTQSNITNIKDLSFLGTRENKTKTDNGESVTKMITDTLIWLCRGCKDTVQEPASQPVPSVSEISSTSETSTEVSVKLANYSILYVQYSKHLLGG